MVRLLRRSDSGCCLDGGLRGSGMMMLSIAHTISLSHVPSQGFHCPRREPHAGRLLRSWKINAAHDGLPPCFVMKSGGC